MTPRQEILETRRIGPSGASLLYRLVRLIAIRRNFPPPPGFERWDDSAVAEVSHDFLDGERGGKRIIDIAIRSVDDVSFERILESAIVNHLRETSRQTDMGRLILRVNEILSDEEEFARIEGHPPRWTVCGGPAAPNTIPETKLAAALSTIEITIPKWNSERRAAPLADRESYIRILRAILGAANGSIAAADIARVVSTRLDHHRSPLSIELEVLETVAERSSRDDPAVQASSAVRARQLFDGLSDRARIVIACYEQPVRDLGDILPLHKSQAASLRRKVAGQLRLELEAEPEPEDTVAELRRLCENWLENRTCMSGTTFMDDNGNTVDARGKGGR
jgi:hypothetical protein